MFPLIPALILLLLQGSTALERGRVPATFDGLPWAVVAKHLEADEAGGSKPKLAHVCALLRLLAPRPEPTLAEANAPIQAPRPNPAPVARLCAGYEDDGRSRDGPQGLI